MYFLRPTHLEKMAVVHQPKYSVHLHQCFVPLPLLFLKNYCSFIKTGIYGLKVHTVIGATIHGQKSTIPVLLKLWSAVQQ